MINRTPSAQLKEALQFKPGTRRARQLTGRLSMIVATLLLASCSNIGGPYLNQDYEQTTEPLPVVNGVTFSSVVFPQENFAYGRKEPFQFNIFAEAPTGSGSMVAIRSVQVNAGKKTVFQKEFDSLKSPVRKDCPTGSADGVRYYPKRSPARDDVDIVWFAFRNVAKLHTNYHVGQVVTVIANVAVTRHGRTEQREVVLRHKAKPEPGLIHYRGP